MSSILSSQGLVLATAMVVSSTALFLAFSKHHNTSLLPRSCFSSDDKMGVKSKNNSKKMKMMKKVRFAEDVKEPRGNGEEYRRKHDEKMERRRTTRTRTSCRNEIPGNRVALYNGILKQRSHRVECL